MFHECTKYFSYFKTETNSMENCAYIDKVLLELPI